MQAAYDTTTQEYVEVIRDLEREFKVARVKDIAERRGVSRSSVSIALNQLVKKELITHEQYGHISLTPAGQELAQDLERKHQAIKKFLTSILGISEPVADKDACTLEHHMSNETLDRLSDFVEFVEKCPHKLKEIIVLYRDCIQLFPKKIDCETCVETDEGSR